MSFAKIALFAFGLATVIAAGAVNANATSFADHSYGTWSNGAYVSPGQALFDRAKGNPQGY